MDIYSIILTALTVLSVFEVVQQRQAGGRVIVIFGHQRSKFNGEKLFVILIVVVFMLISALRDTSVGVDLARYIPRYIYLGSADWKDLFPLARRYSFEYGFAVFCKVLYLINPDPAFFLIVTSIIISAGFYNLSKLSKMPIMTMFIIFAFGIYGSSMNIVRQFIAFAILTVGINYIVDRKIWKFILVVIIATLFHSTAILFAPLYILYTVRFNRNILILIGVISIFVVFFGNTIIGIIASRTSFHRYVSKIGIGSGESTLLFLTVILLVAYVYSKKMMKIDFQDNLCLWVISVAILWNVAALHFAILARVMAYFTPFIAVLVPDIIYAIKKKDKINRYVYLIASILVIAFFLFYYQTVLMGGEAEGAGWFPYILRF